MRGSLEAGDSYGIYVMRGTEDCSQPQRVGFGNATTNPPFTTIPANQVNTIEALVWKANKTIYRVRTLDHLRQRIALDMHRDTQADGRLFVVSSLHRERRKAS